MTNSELLTNIRLLPAEEQFQLANSILDELARAGQLPIPDPIREELARRLEEFKANPDQGQPWEEVRKEIFGD